MKILIDTHYLLWSFIETRKIRKEILDLLLSIENQIYYSQASLWEISIKFNLGKLEIKGMNPEEFFAEVEDGYFKCLKLENEDLISFYRLPIEHRDPFDRIMIWQAIKSDFVYLSSDQKTEEYKKHGLKTI